MTRWLLLVSILLIPTAVGRAENWPGWRGPAGLGHSNDKEPPLTRSETENVRWKALLPDSGNASPVVLGDHVFLAQTGKDLWRQERLTGETWGPLVHTADRPYVTNTADEMLVCKADPPKLDVLARNRLPDEAVASIAISDGDLFIRGYKFLWCISK